MDKLQYELPFVNENCTKDDNDIGTVKHEVIEIWISCDSGHPSM